MSSLRGGFRSVARGVTGSGPAKPSSRAGRVTGNLVTVLLLLVAVALLLRRFAFHHH
jgi:flagellar biogenesis protein FliO